MYKSMTPEQKSDIYIAVTKEVAAVIDGEANMVARMATISNILHHSFDYFFWTGFYLVDPEKPNELVIGPYQGTLGCLRIPFDKGVCGKAAAIEQTQIVDDVHAFPGHIACDARSQSEIVCPVFDSNGKLFAVFDVDSDQKSMFDTVDQNGLEKILNMVFH